MRKISILGVSMVMMILSFTTDSLAQEKRSLKGMLYTHFDVFYPKYLPFEIGLGYQRMITKEYYLSLNYRFAFSTPRSYPSDYKKYGLITFVDFTPKDYMHSISLRVGRDYYLFNRLNWHIELGPSLNFYRENIFHPAHGFQYRSYDIEIVPHTMLGLSIKNSINIADKKRYRTELFWYNNINTRFTYSALGIQIGRKTFKN